jgi:hypothetical protein
MNSCTALYVATEMNSLLYYLLKRYHLIPSTQAQKPSAL